MPRYAVITAPDTHRYAAVLYCVLYTFKREDRLAMLFDYESDE